MYSKHLDFDKGLLLQQSRTRHLQSIRGTVTGDRVPSSHGRKTLRSASRVGAVRNVVEHPRVRVDPRVEEAEGLLADGDARAVDERDDGSDRGRGCTRTVQVVVPEEKRSDSIAT